MPRHLASFGLKQNACARSRHWSSASCVRQMPTYFVRWDIERSPHEIRKRGTMKKRALLPTGQICLVFAVACLLVNCQGMHQATTPPSTVSLVPTPNFTGVLMWKGSPSGNGLFANETKLTPSNVNVSQFGKLGEFKTDAMVM